MAEQNEKFEPVGYNPKGWAMRNYFVDDEGNVFKKGIHVPEDKGKYPPSRTEDEREEKEKKEEAKSETENPLRQEQEKESLGMDKEPDKPPVSEDKSENADAFTREEVEKMLDNLKSTFNEEWQKREDKMREEFKSSFKREEPKAGEISVHDMARAIAQAEEFKSGGKFYRDIRDLDPADYDDKGVMFTSYGNGFLIVDDVRNGFPVTTPYGRIFKFKHQASRITKIGKVESYSAFCSFTTHSRKEIEWLRKHSLYGSIFFENVNMALSANAIKAQIAARVHTAVKSMDQTEILNRAKRYDIPLGGDIQQIIGELVHKMSEEQYQAELQKTQDKNVEAFEQLHN